MGGSSRMVLVACAAALSFAVIPASAGATVPPGFVGMNLGPSVSPKLNMPRQLDRMVASGVQSIRVVFDWSTAQPYANWDQVPLQSVGDYAPDPVPTNFTSTDRIVASAARRGLTVLPVVLYTPGWDTLPHNGYSIGVPLRDAPYGNYLTLLVWRYGPHGTFWSAHRNLPKLPIRMWQIWNEPNLGHFWGTLPSYVPGYVGLLRASHAALRRADPGAKLVLAGLANYVWQSLTTLYKVGARHLFDVVAVHPYTRSPQGVITITQLVRNVMDRYGDKRKPIMLTELGWPSALHRIKQRADFETTPTGQAQKLAAVLPLLASHRRALGLSAFYYFDWISNQIPHADAFNFAGLLGWHDGRVYAKPAYNVFRNSALALEGCRRKAFVVTRCQVPAG